DAVKLAEEKVSTAQLELESLKARIAAEKATFAAESGVQSLALAASRAERAVAAAKAALGLLEAEQQLARVRAAEPPGGADAVPPSPAVVEAEKKLAEARQALTSAQVALENPDGKYAPLGEQFPATSTGRRRALAHWIADPKNPRTARIAIN